MSLLQPRRRIASCLITVIFLTGMVPRPAECVARSLPYSAAQSFEREALMLPLAGAVYLAVSGKPFLHVFGWLAAFKITTLAMAVPTPKVLSLIRAIEESLTSEITPSRIAREAQTTKAVLSRLLRKKMAPSEALQDSIWAALRRLINHQSPLTEPLRVGKAGISVEEDLLLRTRLLRALVSGYSATQIGLAAGLSARTVLDVTNRAEGRTWYRVANKLSEALDRLADVSDPLIEGQGSLGQIFRKMATVRPDDSPTLLRKIAAAAGRSLESELQRRYGLGVHLALTFGANDSVRQRHRKKSGEIWELQPVIVLWGLPKMSPDLNAFLMRRAGEIFDGNSERAARGLLVHLVFDRRSIFRDSDISAENTLLKKDVARYASIFLPFIYVGNPNLLNALRLNLIRRFCAPENSAKGSSSSLLWPIVGLIWSADANGEVYRRPPPLGKRLVELPKRSQLEAELSTAQRRAEASRTPETSLMRFNSKIRVIPRNPLSTSA